jgi:hypothetical protein
MSISLAFWILLLLWLVFGFAQNWGAIPGPYGLWGHSVLLFTLFLLLGWSVYGAPLHG